MKKNIVTTLTVLLLFTSSAAPLTASPAPTGFSLDQCEAVKNRFTSKIQQFPAKKQSYLSIINSLKTQMTGVQQLLESKGIDASALSEAIIRLDNEATSLSSNVDALVAQLRTVSRVQCTQADFETYLNTLKPFIQKVQQDVNDIKQIYFSVFKPFIEQLKNLNTGTPTPT